MVRIKASASLPPAATQPPDPHVGRPSSTSSSTLGGAARAATQALRPRSSRQPAPVADRTAARGASPNATGETIDPGLPVLSEEARRQVWDSSRPKDEYNGRVTVDPAAGTDPDVPKRRIVCEDLSEMRAQTGNRQEYFNKVQSERAIAENFGGGVTEQLHADIKERRAMPEGSHRHVVLADRMGRYLRDVAAQARMLEPPAAEIVVHAGGHTYNFGLCWQATVGEQAHLEPSFYDANLTTTDATWKQHNAEELEGLDLMALIRALGFTWPTAGLQFNLATPSVVVTCDKVDLSNAEPTRYAGTPAELPVAGLVQQSWVVLREGLPNRWKALKAFVSKHPPPAEEVMQALRGMPSAPRMIAQRVAGGPADVIDFCKTFGLGEAQVERLLSMASWARHSARPTQFMFEDNGPERLLHVCQQMGLEKASQQRLLTAVDVRSLVQNEQAAGLASLGRAARSIGMDGDAVRRLIEGEPLGPGRPGQHLELAQRLNNRLVLSAMAEATGGPPSKVGSIPALPPPRTAARRQPMPHLHDALVRNLSDVPSVAQWLDAMESRAPSLLADVAAREHLMRALLAELRRPSAAELVDALAPTLSRSQRDAAVSALKPVLNPAARLHGPQLDALTRRSTKARIFSRDPARSTKLDQRMLAQSALRPRLSQLEAIASAHAHAGDDAALRQRLLREVSAADRLVQHQTITRPEPKTWRDVHPLPAALRARLIEFRNAEQARGGDDSRRAVAAADAMLHDLDAVLHPYVAEPADHPLSLDSVAADVAAVLQHARARASGPLSAADAAELHQRARETLERTPEQRAQGVLRVLREHLTPAQLDELEAEAGRPHPGG